MRSTRRRSPAARVDDGATFDLLGREEVGLDGGAVLEGDARAPIEARVPFEPVERGERGLVDLIHLAGHRALAAAHEPRERAEVAQLERGLGPSFRDEPGAREESVVRLAREERPVDEDARGRATLALGRVHGSTPAAVARGATSKPRRAYARHRTRK